MSDFKIQFKVFEGPMDLLLFLVKKQEVDIYEVNMARLAAQFIEYVEMMKRLDLEQAGEFIVMASTLMYIKSRELLPVDEQVEDGEDDDAEDPRWDLIRRLVEFKRFKDASDDLQRLEIEREKVYTRRPGSIPIDPLPMGNRLEASIFDLVGAVNELLRRVAEREGAKGEIVEDPWSVSEKDRGHPRAAWPRGPAEVQRVVRRGAHPGRGGGYVPRAARAGSAQAVDGHARRLVR